MKFEEQNTVVQVPSFSKWIKALSLFQAAILFPKLFHSNSILAQQQGWKEQNSVGEDDFNAAQNQLGAEISLEEFVYGKSIVPSHPEWHVIKAAPHVKKINGLFQMTARIYAIVSSQPSWVLFFSSEDLNWIHVWGLSYRATIASDLSLQGSSTNFSHKLQWSGFLHKCVV